MNLRLYDRRSCLFGGGDLYLGFGGSMKNLTILTALQTFALRRHQIITRKKTNTPELEYPSGGAGRSCTYHRLSEIQGYDGQFAVLPEQRKLQQDTLALAGVSDNAALRADHHVARQ